MIKFFISLIINYNIKFFLILFYELKYILQNYKGNQINIKKNQLYRDNIPAPYLFLEKINLFLKKIKINTIIDLGCGSGRFIYFFSKKLPHSKIYGVELDNEIFKSTKKLFSTNKRVNIINKNLLDFFKNYKNIKYDIFFLNDPLKFKNDYERLFHKIKKIASKTSFLILININHKLQSLKLFDLIYIYKIGNKNLKIYKINI